MQLTKNFHLSEFACRDGRQVPQKYLANVQLLAKNLQVLRDHIGVPIIINSCYRPPDYNAKIGGAKSSQHLTASAADIRTRSHTPKQLHKIIEQLIKEGKMKQGGLGLYPTFVHYDIRNYKARW